MNDLLNDVYSSGRCDQFRKRSQYRNITVILITLNILHQAKYCGDISQNAKYLVILKKLEIEGSSPVWHNTFTKS